MNAASLIVAGSPFSGAALLGHVLGSHSRAFFAGESWRLWDRDADAAARKCRGCEGECATWNDTTVAAAVADGPAAVAAALAASTGTRLVIEGPAPAARLAARLAGGAASGEDTRIVLCVCDPLLYVRKRAGVTEELAKRRVTEWCSQQDALVSAALATGCPTLVVRYEDLVRRPEETLARVCRFAGLEYESALATWWESPGHAIGATSEAWGVAEPASSVRAVHGDPRERRVETMPMWDADPATSLGTRVARAVIAELRPTGLYGTFGYEPLLPPHRAPRDEAEREELAAWVEEDLRIVREAVDEGRVEAAIPILRLLVDHFGPAVDDLGLEVDFETLASVLVELLQHQQSGAEALRYARALAEHAPRSIEAQQLLATVGTGAGDLPSALEACDRLVRLHGAEGSTPASLPGDVAGLLVNTGARGPAVPGLLGTLAEHAEVAGAVDATLTARLEGGDRAEGVYAALDAVREARGLPLPPHAPPDYLLIALTNRCNCGCFFCCAEEQRADMSQREIPIEQFYSLRSAIESAGVVDLTSPGEVFLYSHAREAMAFVAEHNRNRGIQLTTTGTLKNLDILAPVASRIDHITFSLNAATPETHARDMGSRHWERVLSNIRATRRLVARERITLSCVTHAGNVHELPALVRLAAELDVSHVRIVPIRVTKPESIRGSLWFCKEKAQDLIAEARSVGQEHGITVTNLYETVQSMSSSMGRKCITPTSGAYILLNGNVIACCYSGRVMGSVFDAGGFEAVWNGNKYRALRKHLHFPECRECPATHGVDMDRLESHLDCQLGDRSSLPLVTVAVKAPANAGQVRHAVACLKRQTYPVWEATIELQDGCDPAVRRAVMDEAGADPRIRCGLADARATSHCQMDPARQFKPNELETYLGTLDGFRAA
jgi:MoaA/NifB/PqqE/SkfB family radical SAM enzyme